MFNFDFGATKNVCKLSLNIADFAVFAEKEKYNKFLYLQLYEHSKTLLLRNYFCNIFHRKNSRMDGPSVLSAMNLNIFLYYACFNIHNIREHLSAFSVIIFICIYTG